MTKIHDDSIFAELQFGAELLEAVKPADNSFASGRLGHILYLAYTYKLTGNETHFSMMMQYLQSVLSDCLVHKAETASGTASNLALLCSVLQVLRKDKILTVNLSGPDIAVLDLMIFHTTSTFLNKNNTDLLFGAAGGIHYFLTRVHDNPAVVRYLKDLISLLEKKAIRDELGIRFYNSYTDKSRGNKYIDTGVPHGQCGLLLVLLGVYEAGIARERVRALCDGLICYLTNLRHAGRILSAEHSFYPQGIDEYAGVVHAGNHIRYAHKPGWCYSDLTIALAFYKASHLLNLSTLGMLADDITQDYIRFGSKYLCNNFGIYDGASGLALIYGALYKECKKEAFREAQRYWLSCTRKLMQPQLSGQPLTYDAAFLTGLPGALLTLTAEVKPENTSWQKLLLLN